MYLHISAGKMMSPRGGLGSFFRRAVRRLRCTRDQVGVTRLCRRATHTFFAGGRIRAGSGGGVGGRGGRAAIRSEWREGVVINCDMANTSDVVAKGKATIMLMSMKCGGVGLNLTRANRT